MARRLIEALSRFRTSSNNHHSQKLHILSKNNPNNENEASPKSRKTEQDLSLQEYRLVPIEEWEESQEEKREIDLLELANHMWDRRWFIAKVTGVFVVIGLLVALLSPVEYEVEATLMPESQSTQGTAGSLLQQYGGLLGMSGNFSGSQQGTIPPNLYPTIVQSLPFQLEVLNKNVTFSEPDTTVSVYTYFDEIHTPSFFLYLTEYTVRLPGKIIGALKGGQSVQQPLPKGFETDTVYNVNKSQMNIVDDMRSRISVSMSEQTGVLSLTVQMPDPRAAAEIGQISIDLIKEYIANYQTRKAMEDLEFAQQQLERAEQRFQEIQTKLAEFRDSNVNLATNKAQTREQQLQSEYDLAFNVYNSLAQQVEQARMRVQEQTPVVSILQPIQVPIDDTTSGLIILVLVTVVGFLLSIVWILINSYILDKEDRIVQ